MKSNRLLLFCLTAILAGRAMTLAFISRAGGSNVGDPPIAWMMPLIGDAVVGVGALFIAFLIYRARGLAAWSIILTWNAIAIWDAISAFIVHKTVPWPSFFMVEIFGSSMFFMASAMHAFCIYLLCRAATRETFFSFEDKPD